MVHWFKRHPKHLAIESSKLAHSTDFKELFQVRENLFISHGNIVIRLDKIHYFPILIVYPEATPYTLPLIYPLKSSLSNNQVEELAKLNTVDLAQKIHPFIEFYYNLRHQNHSGVLCILEWDSLDDGSKFYGIDSIIKRIRDWHKGLITGVFPPDSQEVEFYSHFNFIDPQNKFLYPDTFLNKTILEGEAYGVRFAYHPKGQFSNFERSSYFGCLIVGKNRSGIYESIDFSLPAFFFEEGISNATDLFSKKELLDKLIQSRKLLKTFWFQISKEPNPFKDFKSLITIVGNGSYEAGLKRMMPFYLSELKKIPKYIFVAVRFPNRKGIEEFQLFIIVKNKENSTILLNTPDEETFKHSVDAYEKVYAVQCERFSDETYHQRNMGRAERVILAEKSINVVGVGALGSEIADCLNKAGVGNICLFDNQELKAHNPVRHLAGIDHTGFPKAIAVADILNNHNPFVKVGVNCNNINLVDLNDLFLDGSISVSSMADDNTEGFLNERAVISNKTVYYSRALRGGKVARIFRVIPGRDACFNCLSLHRNGSPDFIRISDDENLPILRNECNNPIRPASAADLKLISSLTSRIVLDELQNGVSENNHWIWSTERLPGLEPFQLHQQFIEPHPTCYYCNHEKKVTVIIPKEVMREMQVLISQNNEIETGGVLAGKIDENGNIIITKASGPGPNSTKTSSKFQKDIQYCQKFLDDLYIQSDKQIAYIGEWHSHPNNNNNPSGTDIKSLTEIAYQKEYLTDIPIMIIFSNIGEPSCTIHPAGKRYYHANLNTEVDSLA